MKVSINIWEKFKVLIQMVLYFSKPQKNYTQKKNSFLFFWKQQYVFISLFIFRIFIFPYSELINIAPSQNKIYSNLLSTLLKNKLVTEKCKRKSPSAVFSYKINYNKLTIASQNLVQKQYVTFWFPGLTIPSLMQK